MWNEAHRTGRSTKTVSLPLKTVSGADRGVKPARLARRPWDASRVGAKSINTRCRRARFVMPKNAVVRSSTVLLGTVLALAAGCGGTSPATAGAAGSSGAGGTAGATSDAGVAGASGGAGAQGGDAAAGASADATGTGGQDAARDGASEAIVFTGPCVPPADSTQPVAKLSQTGCVDPNDPTKLASIVVPYEVNSPLWSDGADK